MVKVLLYFLTRASVGFFVNIIVSIVVSVSVQFYNTFSVTVKQNTSKEKEKKKV